jgi:Domain of unknown function (DUF4126)
MDLTTLPNLPNLPEGLAHFDTSHLFAIAAALGWASGLRLYLVVFLTGLAGYLGWVPLPTGLSLLESPVVLWGSGAMLAVEFLADKVPWVDSLWDSVHTVVRIPAGAALAYGVFGGDQSQWAMLAALMGGTLAATSHTAKATTRAAANAVPEPFTNVALSLLDDMAAPAMLWLSVQYPVAFWVALVIALVIMIAAIVVLFRFLRGMRRKLQNHFVPTKFGGELQSPAGRRSF